MGIMVDIMTAVTRILSEIEQGEPAAADELLPLAYEEHRKLAAAQPAHEKPDQSLEATAPILALQ